MNTKHTLTPWTSRYLKDYGFIIETPNTGSLQDGKIADVVVRGGGESRANTDFIVRAVNAHEALVAVLKELDACLNQGITLGIQPGSRGAIKIREALALAEGEAK